MKSYYLHLTQDDFFDAERRIADSFSRPDSADLGFAEFGNVEWASYDYVTISSGKLRVDYPYGTVALPIGDISDGVVEVNFTVSIPQDFPPDAYILYGAGVQDGDGKFFGVVVINDGYGTIVRYVSVNGDLIPISIEGHNKEIRCTLRGTSEYYDVLIDGAHVWGGHIPSMQGEAQLVFMGQFSEDIYVNIDNVEIFFNKKQSKKWITRTIDLFDTAALPYQVSTPSYTNYSVIQSSYGPNVLGNNVWTGIDNPQKPLLSGATPTDTGYINDGRYVDTSGRIDVFDWSVNIAGNPGTEEIIPVLDFFTIDEADIKVFPVEWASKTSIADNRIINFIDSYRYARFQLELHTDQDVSDIELDMYVRVRFGETVQSPLYNSTRNLLNKFPTWMSMRDDILDSNSSIPDNWRMATPTTTGAQLLNAVSGQWLEDIDQDILKLRLEQYIDTSSLTQVAWAYVSPYIDPIIWRVEGDNVLLSTTATLQDFYEADPDSDIYFIDVYTQSIYTRKKYVEFKLNDRLEYQQATHIWNWFDEFGLHVDLYRLPGEGNESFKGRILDVYKNRPGVGVEAFKLALRRELNMWAVYGSTPNSDFLGATPEVLELYNLDVEEEFTGADGLPTERFKDLISKLAIDFPVTWGFFKWDEAWWDIGGDNDKGFKILPHQYDVDPLPDEYRQSGIGDGDDMFVYRPDVITGPQEFNAKLKVRGRTKTSRLEHTEISINVDVFGSADKTFWENPTVGSWVTFIVTTNEPTPRTLYAEKYMSATSDVNTFTPTPTSNSYTEFPVINDGMLNVDLVWKDSNGIEVISLENSAQDGYATPSYVSAMDVDTITVWLGRWVLDGSTPSHVDTPVDNVTVWLSNDNTNTVSSADALIDSVTSNVLLGYPTVIMQSNETYSYVDRWKSPPQNVSFKLNGMPPANSVQNYTLEYPEILWDSHLMPSPGKKIEIQLTNRDSSGNYTAIAHDADGNLIELPASAIKVNGSNAWVNGNIKLNDGSVSEFEFSSTTSVSPQYPVTAYHWDLFEADQVSTIYGVVDENGPWRNGSPSTPGNTNFALMVVSVDRDDFAIPNTADYVITWIGVEVMDNTRVLTWLYSNSIKPYDNIDEFNEIVYPDNAINESYDSDIGKYYFEPFHVCARLRPYPDKQWNPQVHSGWFHEGATEYYMYSRQRKEIVDSNNWVLDGVSRMGAPIHIVSDNESTPTSFRHVAFYDQTTPGLTLRSTESVYGSGATALYLAYNDVYDISVKDTGVGADFASNTETEPGTNIVYTTNVTNRNNIYEVEYLVRDSFYADNEYVAPDGTQRTRLMFSRDPSMATPYTVYYEGSKFDPATPIDLPLNTFYTIYNEGFIYVSHDEYPVASAEVRVSPSTIVADGQDYIIVTVRSVDIHGNPKPYEEFQVSTDFGTFDGAASPNQLVNIITDRDGFAVITLMAGTWTNSVVGTITVIGQVNSQSTFQIDPVAQRKYRLVAVPSVETIEANGQGLIMVYGAVEDSNYTPVPYAKVQYRKGRSVYESFTKPRSSIVQPQNPLIPVWENTGMVVADGDGRFTIGPWNVATPYDPGYWFVVVESEESASPDIVDPSSWQQVGDVVFWLEYPDITFGVNEYNELPHQLVQYRHHAEDTPEMATVVAFPYTYDDATPEASATPSEWIWEPPQWYALPMYTQYQVNKLGAERGSLDYSNWDSLHPDYKDM